MYSEQVFDSCDLSHSQISVIKSLTVLPRRLCIISAFHLKSITEYESANLTHSILNIGIWTFLEPCLGVINACLPVLPPAAQRSFPSRAMTWARRYTKGIADMLTGNQGLTTPHHPRGSDMKRNHRNYEDVYPLIADSGTVIPEQPTSLGPLELP